jgi:cytochrome c peroxidase
MIQSVKTAMVAALLVGLSLSAHAAEKPSVALGEKLFNDPSLGGATASKSCNSCHPSGKGVENAWKNPKLGEQINTCITGALKGSALPMESVQMRSLILYLQSLKPASMK